jgi:hypothetical protein
MAVYLIKNEGRTIAYESNVFIVLVGTVHIGYGVYLLLPPMNVCSKKKYNI